MWDNLYHQDDLYGGYRNATFSEIFDNSYDFWEFFDKSGVDTKLTEVQLTELFYLLYSEYGNSPIASSDVNRFKYKMLTISNSAGPIYFKKMEIQAKLAGMTDEEMMKGNTNILNTSLNPSNQPTTQTLDELETINQQNVTKSKRGKLEGYAALYALMDEDLTEEFLMRYRKLFLQVVAPEDALWYETLEPNIPIEQEDNQ